jgi:hypothetical protein
MRTRTIPRGARHLRAYADFRSYLEDFVCGRYRFLWFVGRPGITKTESLRAAVRGRNVYHAKGGQLTPAQFYKECYRHLDQPIILDDAEHLLENKVGAKLISALGDTTPARLLCYATTSRVLEEVPQRFWTTSPLCLLSNRATAHEHILSRAVTLYFDPTNLEVHRAVAAWFWDQQIHDWFGQHLFRLPPLDARWYVTASADKEAGRDWERIVLETHVPDRALSLIQDLERDPAHPTREDKARRFKELMGDARGASRGSYFRMRSRLEQAGRLEVEAVAPIPLRRRRPPATPSRMELDSIEATVPAPPEQEEPAADVPARAAFAQPVRGPESPPASPSRMLLDDRLPWEDRPGDDEEGEE